MIEELERKIKQIQVVIDTLPDIVNQAVRDNAAEVIKMNVGQQLKGQNAKGSKLGNYAESTKKQRRKKGLQVSFIDLEDTKNYHSNFAISYQKDRIELASPDTSYSLFLDNRWKDLFGLTKENLEVLSKLIDPICNKAINKILS